MSQINRVSNPSFETDTLGWTAVGTTTGAPIRTAGIWGWGAFYGKLTALTTGVAIEGRFGVSTYAIAAVPGDRAFASVKLKADNVGAEGVRAWLRLEFWDVSNANLMVTDSATYFLTTDKQTVFLLAADAPPNTVKVVAKVLTLAADTVAGDIIAIDGLDLRLNEPPDTYMDGDSINVEWTGTAHASTSIRVDPVIFANPKNWKSGAVLVEGLLYRCDENGTRLDDLSKHVEFGRVTWNSDKGPGQKLAGEFRLNQRGLVRTYVDFLAPVLRLTWRDGTVDEKQFGLFLCDFPEDNVFQRFASQAVHGLDPTWFPNNSAIRDTINYASSDKVVSKMKDLIVASGWDRVVFPNPSRTFGAAKSLYPGIRRYKAAADQLEAMNYYVPFPDLAGNIRTMPYLDMARLTPAIVIEYEDFVGEWQVRPTTTTLANVVSVYKENTASAGVPIGSVAVNADPSSRISTAYRPEILREITNANIQTQAEADALTLSLLQESASYYRVISGKLSPGVWMEPYCAADVYLQHADWGNLSGRYYVREWVVSFTQSDAEVQVEMNRTVEFGASEDQ